ncbi:uncharacterized protein LOC110023703 isoform X2 [Phalaenopsis equestris]|uniref:uncharacterized protein LOC110023703 isoform X2 n=1 Tax=Phalaenopsis equestris TaxID=78828 RepID=UPI0009E3938A|nr:uncharacterized protein LOC110023703 isoform X2 [Phalaenopsis equestris]
MGGIKTAGGLRAPAVCCMCGDQGLCSELFRCRVCLFRSQHRYCSNLYPKAHSYQACNWCLREEMRSNKLSLAAEQTVSGNNISALTLTPVAQRSSGCGNLAAGGGRGGGGLKLTNRCFSPPAKKQRLASAEGLRGGGEQISTGDRKGRQGFRGRVRRYKLLEEVIC